MELREIVPWGRSFEEYRRMFGLSGDALAGRLLGCGDGPASFNAEATARGHAVVSCDPIYGLAPEEIRRRVEGSFDEVLAQVRRSPEGFVWNYFRDPDALGQARLAAMNRFLADFAEGEGRYVAASLPRLPFGDAAFDLAVCSHLLFLYSDQLSLAFHLAAVEELLRVAGEVRIFPLVNLERRVSPHLEPLRRHLAEGGWTTEVRQVAYEFQRGGDTMLRIARNA